MGVITYRSIRGQREEEPVVHYLVAEHYLTEGPDGFVPPPGYVPGEGQGYEYLDVKVPLDVNEEAQGGATEQD